MKKYALREGRHAEALYEGDDVEGVSRALACHEGHRSNLTLEIALPIPLAARVKRAEGKPDVVVVSGPDFEKEFVRMTAKGGELGVSCDMDGDDVPVDTVNVEFQSLHSKALTDRSLVWVRPGEPATASVSFYPQYGVTEATYLQVVTDAEKAVDELLLRLLPSGAAK